MATETQHELVAAALLEALRQIDANNPNFWYGPGEVFRVSDYRAEFFQQEKDHFVMLRCGSADVTREMNCEWAVEREFFVMCGRKDDDAERLPWDAEPADGGALPTTVQERMVGDVEQALTDDTLDGTADQVDIVGLEYGYSAGPWTLVEVTLNVKYHAPKRTVN